MRPLRTRPRVHATGTICSDSLKPNKSERPQRRPIRLPAIFGMRGGGEIFPAGNVHREGPRHRYQIDPAEHLGIEKQARACGWSVIGVYHSHPDVGAYFSDEDKRRALPFPDMPLYPCWIVADVTKGKALGARLFVWSAAKNDFLEQPLEITD